MRMDAPTVTQPFRDVSNAAMASGIFSGRQHYNLGPKGSVRPFVAVPVGDCGSRLLGRLAHSFFFGFQPTAALLDAGMSVIVVVINA